MKDRHAFTGPWVLFTLSYFTTISCITTANVHSTFGADCVVLQLKCGNLGKGNSVTRKNRQMSIKIAQK